MLSIRDYLILLITNTSHKLNCLVVHRDAHLSYKRYKVLENFISMAIQGTQVPMYTKHTLFFLYFSDFFFNFFFKFLYQKQNRQKIKKLKINKQKHVKQNKA